MSYIDEHGAEWFATLHSMPRRSDGTCPRSYLFSSEKEAIAAARKLRIAEIDRLTGELNALDARFDQIETEETRKP